MANLPALINGQAYSYTDIVMLLAGVPLASVSEINYKIEQEKVNNIGLSSKPVSRGRGAKNPTGSIKVAMDETQVIRANAPNGSLLDIPPFDIQVTFLNPTTEKLATHILKNCEFTVDGHEMAAGDTEIAMTYDLIIGDIIFIL